MLKFFKELIKRNQMSQIERYLGQSVDLIDLERREKELKYRGFYI